MSKWNEKDEAMFKNIIASIRFAKNANDPKFGCLYDCEIQWLKQIKRKLEDVQ
jgi:hypothetical protein